MSFSALVILFVITCLALAVPGILFAAAPGAPKAPRKVRRVRVNLQATNHTADSGAAE